MIRAPGASRSPFSCKRKLFGLADLLERQRFLGNLGLGAAAAVRFDSFAPFADRVGEAADLVAQLVAARPQEHAGSDRAADRSRRGDRVGTRGAHDAAILVAAFGIVVPARTAAIAAALSATIIGRHSSCSCWLWVYNAQRSGSALRMHLICRPRE